MKGFMIPDLFTILALETYERKYITETEVFLISVRMIVRKASDLNSYRAALLSHGGIASSLKRLFLNKLY